MLLVRNPIDVMASYYSFLIGLGEFSGSIDGMVDHPDYGITAWTSHTIGWLDGVTPQASFWFVKYEELRTDPCAVLAELYRLIGFELKPDVISTAVERASFELMRGDEARFVSRHPRLGDWSSFGAAQLPDRECASTNRYASASRRSRSRHSNDWAINPTCRSGDQDAISDLDTGTY